MQADLKKFERALVVIHPGTYTHQSPEQFKQLVNDLLLETSKPLEATAFYRVVLKLIAGIHDGHTQAYTFGKLGNVVNNQTRLPFQVYVQRERVFVVQDMSAQKIPEGSEILALDGHLSNKILLRVLEHYSSDGNSSSGMYHWLGGPYRSFNRIYSEVYGERSSHDLVYRDYRTREIVSTQVDAISTKVYESVASEKYPSSKTPEDAFHFSIDEKEAYAYLRISRFFKDGFDEPENTYPDFYKECFKAIFTKDIENLVIDLRDNGGGKASNAAYLLQYLIDSPLTPTKEISTLGNDEYFLKITGVTLDLDGAFGLSPTDDGRFKVTRSDVMRDLRTYVPIEEHGFTGRLVVLINGGTTSAAGIAAGLLKEHTDSTFVGEETYGYAGISNGVRQVSIKGDHTETAIYLPLLHAEFNMDEQVRRRSVVPDYLVSNSVRDVLNDTDAVMEFVLGKFFQAEK